MLRRRRLPPTKSLASGDDRESVHGQQANEADGRCTDTPDERAAAFDDIGLVPSKRGAATKWATDAFERAYGWPAVFFTLDAVKDARARFFPNGDLVILGLGLPAQYRDPFVREATPPPQEPGFAPQGKSRVPLATEQRYVGWLRLHLDSQ